MWLLYFLFWIYMFFSGTNSLGVGVGMGMGLFVVCIQMMVVYPNVYYLIPHFLYERKVVKYCLLLFALWSFSIGIMYLQGTLFPVSVNSTAPDTRDRALFPVFITIFSSSLPTFVLILYEKLKEANKIKKLEKESVEYELKFLKAQINPHFLFNSINSIFQLIDKDAEQAKTYLAKFSEMLRYHLYETGLEKVPLSLEIDYLRSYAAMEKLRKGKNLELSLDIQEGIGYIEIVPLLILTFAENAFKHVSNHFDRPNEVNVSISKIGVDLRVNISNTKDPMNVQTLLENSGIGLNNVRKRLELIYPDKHQLDIANTEDRYEVSLILNLQLAYEVHHH